MWFIIFSTNMPIKEISKMYNRDNDLYDVYNNGKINFTIEKIKKIANIPQNHLLTDKQQDREGQVIDNYFCFSDHPGISNNKNKNFVLIAGRQKYEEERLDKIVNLVKDGVYVFTKKTPGSNVQYNYCGTDSYEEATEIWEKLGQYIQSIFDTPSICITGSVGKSTTTQFTRAIFENVGKIFSTPGNLNTMDIIVTKMAREFNEKYDYVVQECGGGHKGLVEQSAKVFHPDIFCITNVKGHHLREYGTIEDILFDKTSLDRHAKDQAIGIINGDDELLCNYNFSHKVIRCGIKNQDCEYVAKNIRQNGFKLNLDVWNNGIGYPISIEILGEYNAYNALFAFAIAKESGIPVEKIISTLNDFKQTDRKRQFTQEIAGRLLIVDCFNVSVDSILGGMKILNDIKTEVPGASKIAMIGGENRLGKTAFSENYKLGVKLSQFDNIDKIIFYGHPPETSAIDADDTGHSFAAYQGAKRTLDIDLFYQCDPDICAQLLKRETKPGDYIYFKGHCYKPMWSIIDKAFGTNYQFETKMQWDGLIREHGYTATKVKVLDECVITSYAGNLNHLIIPDVLEEMAVHGLANNMFRKKTVRDIDLGDSIMYIGDLCFEKCDGFENLETPYSCKYIGSSAFSSCAHLKHITFNSVLTIGKKAFADCPQLERVVFRKDCYTIKEGAFGNCPKLTIYGPKKSNISKYAKSNKIPFRSTSSI